MIKLI